MATSIPTSAVPAAAQRVIRTSGRKRKAVTYLADDYSEALDDGEEDVTVESAEPDSDNQDHSLGYKKGKPSKKKAKTTSKAKKSARAKKAKAVKPFRFMDLPPELRDEIYELALVEPEGLVLVTSKTKYRQTITRGTIAIENSDDYVGKKRRARYWRRNPTSETLGEVQKTELIPSLCAVNKQVRQEASSVLYKQEILLEDMTALYHFLQAIGPYNRRMLARLTVMGWGESSTKAHNHAAFSAMTECTNLESIFLDCSLRNRRRYGTPISPRRIAGQIYQDAHYFLEAYGTANGRYDAGIEVLEMREFHFMNRDRTGQPTTFSQEMYDEFEKELRSLLKKRA